MKEDVKSIIVKVRSGDERAFDDLCKKYSALLTSSAERYYGMTGGESEMSSEDFRQEASIALYRAAKTFDVDQTSVTFGLYAKTCIRNALVSLLRKTSKKPRVAKNEGELGTGGDPLSGVVAREIVGEVKERLLSVLSPYEYKVLLGYAEGKTPRQLAREYGKSAKSVSNALFRARDKLKENFRR